MSITREYILSRLRASKHFSHCAENAEDAGFFSASEILDFLVDELDREHERAQHYHDLANEWESNYRQMCMTCDEIEKQHREERLTAMRKVVKDIR